MKEIFNIITYPLSLPIDPILNYIIMLIIGAISFRIAFWKVGELDLHGVIGSLAHWTIRLFVFVVIWAICDFSINLIIFIINYWMWILSIITILFIFCALFYFSKKYPNSILNKKII